VLANNVEGVERPLLRLLDQFGAARLFGSDVL
jgi:hypothetical protein